MANVLDVGFLFRLVCAIPFRYHLSIHRKLDNGVVLGERLFVILCFALKLFLQRLQGTRRHTSHSPHQLIVFCLAFRLFTFHKCLAFEHLISRIFNERFPQIAHSIVKLLLELFALRVILGNVFQRPPLGSRDLFFQRLVYEEVRTSNLP